MRSIRTWIALLMAVLLAASCVKSDDSSAENDGTDPTAASVPLTASARGVTEDTITLGVPIIDFAALEAVDVFIDRGDQQLAYEAVADALNERGGILGRQIEMVFSTYDLLDNAQAEATCVELTEDNEVFAVLGAFEGPSAPVTRCIPEGGVIELGGQPELDAPSPWFSQLASSTRTNEAMIRLFSEEGVYDGKTVGVIGSVENEALVNDVIVPTLEEVGVEPAEVIIDDTPVNDTAAADANYDVYVERLRAAGVDHVMFSGGASVGGANQLIERNFDVEMSSADSQSVTGIGSFETHPPEAYAGYLTLGGATGDESWASEENQVCVADFEERHPDIEVLSPDEITEGDTDYGTAIGGACELIGLFEMIATQAGPDLNHQTFSAAAEAMTEFSLGYRPFMSFGPDKHDGDDGFRIMTFDPDADEFGEMVPAGDIIDTSS